MNVFYEALGLSPFKELDYNLPYEKVVSYCQSETKKAHFLEILSNVVSLKIAFSLKDIPAFSETTLLQKLEIQVIEVELENASDFKPVIEAMEACIPYDTILLFVSKGKYLAHYFSKNFYKNDRDEFFCLETDWIYEEELERFLDYDSVYYPIREIEEICDLLDNLAKLSNFENICGEMCLRRLVDMLIIREDKWDENYILNMLSALNDWDEISLVEDSQFVNRGKAEVFFENLNGVPWSRVLIDERYNANHRYIVDGITRAQMDDLWDAYSMRATSRPWEEERRPWSEENRSWMKDGIDDDDFDYYGYEG